MRPKKKSGKTFLDSWFLINFAFWPERVWNLLETFRWVTKTKFYVSRGKIMEQSFCEKSLKFHVFRMNYEFFGTVTKNVLQGWQNWNKNPEEQIKETPFSEEKTYCFSKILSELFFNFSGNVRQNCQNCIQRCLGRFWVKPLLEALDKVSNLFVLWARNFRTFYLKVFFVSVSTASRLFRVTICGKSFFPEHFCFCFVLILSFSYFLCVLANKVSSCVILAIHVYEGTIF